MTRIWQNGELIASKEACVSAADRGFLLGDGVFETLAIHNGKPFDLAAHLDRLAFGLAVLGFADAVDIDHLNNEALRYVAGEGAGPGVLRITVTRGPAPRGLAPPAAPSPTIIMSLSPAPPAREEPISLHIAAATRRNELSPVSRIKALSYLDNIIALREAQSLEADDALMLNTCGAIACASAANIFIIRGDRLETPPVADGALPGTMRAKLLTFAQSAGLTAIETSLFANDVAEADHVLLTNSIQGIVEAGHCDGAALALRAGGAVERLRALIAAAIEEG
jgi:branched-chain amino acid aminotransferase